MTELTEWESIQRLGDELPFPRQVLTLRVEEALTACDEFGGRVVLKSSGVAHKSDLGLVRVGLDIAGVRAIWHELAKAGDGTVLCAEVVSGELELIVGGLRDPHFGPVVTIGLGGVTAEIFADAVTLLAPPVPGELDSALSSLRGNALLRGHRGGPAVNLLSLEKVVMAVSDLLESDPAVIEIDCNPVLIRQGEPLVLDALVVTEQRRR